MLLFMQNTYASGSSKVLPEYRNRRLNLIDLNFSYKKIAFKQEGDLSFISVLKEVLDKN